MEAETQLDVSMSLSIFFLKNVGVWISDDPAEKRRMKILVLVTLWNTIFGAIVIFRDIYFTFMYNGVSVLLLFFFLIKLNLCMEIFGWKIFEKFYSIKINSNVEIFFLSKKFISLLSIVNNETTTDEIHCILSTMEIENFCRRLYIFFFFSHSF